MVSAKVDQATIVYYLEGHPSESLASIGRRFGLTRERIRQIVEATGVKRLPRIKVMITTHCDFCGRPIEKEPWTYKPDKMHFCSQEHWREYVRARRVTLICEACGGEYQRKESELRKSGSRWCSMHCHGVQLGRNYGRGR